MQPQSVGQISQTLDQSILSSIGTDNVILQYLIGILAISFLGFITTKIPVWSTFMQTWLYAKVAPDYPTIKFTFTKQKNAQSISGATNAVLAWLEKIKKSIKDYKIDDADYETVKIIRSIPTSQVYDHTRRAYTLKSHWLPDQTTPFVIDDGIFVKLVKANLQAKSGETCNVDEYTLFIYTDKGLKYLLTYHDELQAKYEERLKSKYETVPHIFTLDSYDEKTKKLKWNKREFSSSRKLEHIWFIEKESFVNAYKNFLYKKIEYDKRGDPYTFSLLLYGPPGCGKTSLLKALINYDLEKRDIASHLFVIPFSKIETNDIFKKVMLEKVINGAVIPMNKRIYVFEDFDANDQSEVFNIRDSLRFNENKPTNRFKNKKDKDDKENKQDQITTATTAKASGINSEEKKDEKKEDSGNKVISALTSFLKSDFDSKTCKLNLSDILNTLDGLCERTGQRCIWTTNSYPPQKYFDPAFLRPGRMDMIIKLGRCTRDGIKYLIRGYFDIYDDDDIKLNDIDLNCIEEDRFTPAEVKQICKEALNMKNAIIMMKEICTNTDNNTDIDNKDIDEKDNDNKANGLANGCPPNKMLMKRACTLPLMSLPQPSAISRLHSGHWFDLKTKSIEKTTLLDIPMKSLLNDKDDVKEFKDDDKQNKNKTEQKLEIDTSRIVSV